MTKLKFKNIAIDFDGTIVDDAYPSVGQIKSHAARVINKIKTHGGRVIIWTCRTSHFADEAKDLLDAHAIKYDAFNDNLPENKIIFPDNGRKIWADVYIDDKANFCEEIDWLYIESKLFTEDEGEVYDT